MIFVITVSMLREGFEDYFRYREDEKQNSAKVLRYQPSKSEFKEIKSADIKVGDVLKITDGMAFPCDLVLLASSADGNCFIKTASLDGEKNLKKRQQAKDFKDLLPNEAQNTFGLAQLKGSCKVA